MNDREHYLHRQSRISSRQASRSTPIKLNEVQSVLSALAPAILQGDRVVLAPPEQKELERLHVDHVTVWRWVQVDAAIEKLLREDRLNQAILDLKCLMKSEDSFQWPLVDPNYCLALTVFRKFKDANDDEEDEG